jgi:KTSC domain
MDTYDQLMSAPSKGTFVNKQIKNFYAFVRVG